ncbi:hypothetical protein OsI_15340 [Oryza sativa Indica Group]|uniref:Uncharacterized protein n=1 Tax=Oryza sativa subsp. indica TaxID=39946 RepID=B8AS87_ORYSI|nr:hypothetical protein OsI_15340 [Oryza sativa Indica Group]
MEMAIAVAVGLGGSGGEADVHGGVSAAGAAAATMPDGRRGRRPREKKAVVLPPPLTTSPLSSPTSTADGRRGGGTGRGGHQPEMTVADWRGKRGSGGRPTSGLGEIVSLRVASAGSSPHGQR